MRIGLGLGIAMQKMPPSFIPGLSNAPAITGTATVGQTLTAVAGTWTGSPTVTRQWLRNSTAISGATGVTYMLVAADEGTTITVQETATNAGGTVSATSAGVGPVEALLSSPAAFGASDWTFAAAAATGQTVLTLSAVPDGTKAVDYSFDGGTTVHTLMDAGTGARYLPGLTPGASMSITIRARNSAGASAWTAAKTADAGTVKGAAATTIGTVPASGAPLSHYHMPSQLAGADGSEVLSLADLNGVLGLTAPTGLAPVVRTDRHGRRFTRCETTAYTYGLRNDTVATNSGEFAVFLVGRVIPNPSGQLAIVNSASATPRVILSATPVQGDTLQSTVMYGASVVNSMTTPEDKFAAAMPVGQLVLIGGVYRRAAPADARHYLNARRKNGAQSIVGDAGTGFRLAQNQMDLYEAVVVNGTLSDAEADAIAAAICANWGLAEMPNALVLEGDSITRGAGSDVTGWWVRPQMQAGMADLIPANCKLFNTAISGNKIGDIITQRDGAANWMTVSRSPARNTMVLQIGYNNISDGIESIKTQYAAYFTGETGILARGLNVQVVANINNTANHPVVLALREWLVSADFLNTIGAGPGQTYEGRVKLVQPYLAEDAGIRPLFSDAGGSAYYVDGVHPGAEGTRVMVTGGDTPQHGIMADVA